MRSHPTDAAVAQAYWELAMAGTLGRSAPSVMAWIEQRAREIDATRAQAPAAGDGWKPIESAPKDGRMILLGSAGVRPYTGRWHDNTWMDVLGLSRGPSHWRPLPQPPLSQSEAGVSNGSDTEVGE